MEDLKSKINTFGIIDNIIELVGIKLGLLTLCSTIRSIPLLICLISNYLAGAYLKSLA